MLNYQIFLHQSPCLSVDGIPVINLVAIRAFECIFIIVILAEYVLRPAAGSELKEQALMAQDSFAIAALGHGVGVQALEPQESHNHFQ